MAPPCSNYSLLTLFNFLDLEFVNHALEKRSYKNQVVVVTPRIPNFFYHLARVEAGLGAGQFSLTWSIALDVANRGRRERIATSFG